MAQKSGFFNSVAGDRVYDSSSFAAYFASFISNGIFPNPATNLNVIAISSMTISVTSGKAWINGYYYQNTDYYSLSLEVADGVLKRIDKVVLQLSYINREIILKVKKGTPASSPVAPGITRDADIFELALADVFINAGAVGVSQANITDLRLNSTVCGIAHGLIEQVDTTDIFNQYQAALNQFTTEQTAEFTSWLESLQAVLDENAEGNLLNLINSHKDDANNPHSVTCDQIGATSQEAFSAHVSESASTTKKGHVQLYNGTDSTSTSLAATANAVNAAMEKANQAFQFANDGKATIASAITNKGVTASPADTFALLASKVGQIATGKKTASGTAASNTNQLLFPCWSSGNVNNFNYNHITITGLDFTPSLIFMVVKSSNYNYNHMTLYHFDGICEIGSKWRVLMTETDCNRLMVADLGTNGYVQNGGFKLPTKYNGTHKWYAFE